MELEEIMMSHQGEELQLVIESKETGERVEYRHSGYYCKRDEAHGCLIVGEGHGLENPSRLKAGSLSVRRIHRILNFMWDIEADNREERYGILIGSLLFL